MVFEEENTGTFRLCAKGGCRGGSELCEFEHQVKYWKTLTVRELLHFLSCVCLASRSNALIVSYYIQSMRLNMGIKRLVHGQYIPRSSRAY